MNAYDHWRQELSIMVALIMVYHEDPTPEKRAAMFAQRQKVDEAAERWKHEDDAMQVEEFNNA